MKPVSPVIPDKHLPEVVVAESQDEYQNLPAIRLSGGVILCRWKLDEEERRRVAETGDIYLLQWTGGDYVTPMLLQTEPPEIPAPRQGQNLPQVMTAPRRSADLVNKAKKLNFVIFDDQCSECGCNVVYTEATKETLDSAPETKLICTVCFSQMQKANPEIEGVFLPNTAGEMEKILAQQNSYPKIQDL